MTDPLIEIRRAGERFVSTAPGLVSRHSFAFGEHYDPANVGFGSLLVNNEDVIEVARGYDDHPHRDAEIVTWVLSGSLHHRDSYGNEGLVYPDFGTTVVEAEDWAERWHDGPPPWDCGGIDWGWNNPFGALAAHLDGDDVLWVGWERHGSRITLTEHSSSCRSTLARETRSVRVTSG